MVEHEPPVAPAGGEKPKLAVDRGGGRQRRRRWGEVGEQVGAVVVDVVDEDAAHRAREEVREQQRAAVHDVAPRLTDAPGHGDAPQREPEEDGGEGVVWQRLLGRIRSMDARGGAAGFPMVRFNATEYICRMGSRCRWAVRGPRAH